MRRYDTGIVKIELTESSPGFSKNDSFLLLGSCFSQYMSNHMHDHGLIVNAMPYGIQYNPESIFKSIVQVLSHKDQNSNSIVFNNEQWHHFDLHSDFSKSTEEELIQSHRLQSDLFRKHLLTSNRLFITFGTAHAFRHITQNEIVNNCHKLPGTEFQLDLLSIQEMFQMAIKAIDTLISENPDVKIVLNVSPVMHSNAGLIGNSRSKSRLIELCHLLVERYNNRVFYFPSFEIVRTELRDYRFYESDGKHPNPIAANHVWEALLEWNWDLEIMEAIQYFKTVKKASQHKFSGKQPQAEEKLFRSIITKIEAGRAAYPFLNWDSITLPSQLEVNNTL